MRLSLALEQLAALLGFAFVAAVVRGERHLADVQSRLRQPTSRPQP